MHSAPHRSNILDPQMNIIGIALVRYKGDVWAVEDFAHAVEALRPSEIEGRVIGLLAQQECKARQRLQMRGKPARCHTEALADRRPAL
jgi:hypothetical protein